MTRERGLETVLILAAIVMLTVCVAAVYHRSPTHSIAQIENAINTHDVKKFEKYVDVDSLINRGLDDSGGGYQMFFDRESLVYEVRGRLLRLVESENEPVSMKSDMNEMMKSFEIEEVLTEGNAATVTIRAILFPNQQPSIVKLAMRDQGSYWRVTHVANLNEVIQTAW